MAITHLINELHKANDNKEYTICIFLDLSKAFDTVDHYILIQN
uniref:Reverse transcriptase domain-containing protein n=1 Tax=Anguilla anguilla TaxID=7936 RepID=A0A0E9P808_ANGAN